MTNMFKKSVLAIALAGMSAGSIAAEITPAGLELSKEFLTKVKVDATTGKLTNATDITAAALGFTYEMEANYAVNDTITFTFSSDAVAASSLPATVKNEVAGTFVADDIVLSRISSEVEGGKVVAVYRVSSMVAELESSGAEFVFEGLEILPRKLTANLAVQYAAKTATNLKLDTDGDDTDVDLVEVTTQFTKLSTDEKFAAIVDVNQERKQFDTEEGDLPAGEFEVTEEAPADLAATVTEVVYTVTGDFSWLLDEEGEVDAAVAEVDSNVGTVEVFEDKVVITHNAIAAPVLTITPDEDNSVVIPDQDFTVSAVLTYTAGTDETEGTVSFSAIDAGSWVLNGASVQIPYMPYGDNITQVINLNNAGTQTGDVTVEGFDRAGNKFGPVVIGSAAAGKQVAFAEAIKNALSTAKISSNERVSLKLVANVPSKDVTVYSAYNVNGTGARIVVNSSNGK